MKKIISIVCFFIVLIEINAQNYSNKFSFIDSNRRYISFNFDLNSNLIIIPLYINNSDTIKLILDSGLRTTMITEISQNKTIPFNYARKMKIRGLGEGEDLEVWHSYQNRLSSYGIVGSNQIIYILNSGKISLSSQMGIMVNGLIGSDIFKSFVVEINYLKKIITLHNPKYFDSKKFRYRKFKTIPIVMHKYKPYIFATVVLEDKSELLVKLLVDSGSSDALWLFKNSSNKIKIPNKNIETYLGFGLNGKIYGKKGRVKSIDIGGFKLENPITSFPDSFAVRNSIIQDIKGRNGSIGGGILSRFHIIYDYSRSRILIKPNSNFKRQFNLNLSGMELKKPYLKLPIYVIHNVTKNSPAYIAGLKEDDQIVSINRIKAINYSLNNIVLLLQSRTGRKIRIKVNRNGKIIKTKIILKKTI